MIKFIIPTEEYLQSYKEALDEYRAHNITTYHFTDAYVCDVFEKFERYRRENTLPPDRVREDKYWLVDDERAYFIGEVGIRHRLNDALSKGGGHIGYGVRYLRIEVPANGSITVPVKDKTKAVSVSFQDTDGSPLQTLTGVPDGVRLEYGTDYFKPAAEWKPWSGLSWTVLERTDKQGDTVCTILNESGKNTVVLWKETD